MARILITGSNGQVGSEIRSLKNKGDHDYFFFNKLELDITDLIAVEKKVNEVNPDIIINAAAYTNVDGAEDNEDTCYQVNVEGVKNLAAVCQKKNIFLLHYSSDYVYNHNPDRALIETDENHPEGIYAKSKLASEKMVSEYLTDYVILRTSWVYSRYGKNFVDTMLYYGKERDELQVVYDQIGAPTYAEDIAKISLSIIENRLTNTEKKIQGIYNYSNEGITNWADYARKIFEIAEVDCKVNNVTTESYNAKAHRPKWSVMDKQKLKSTLKIDIPNWEDSLSKYISSVSS
jgi:dTDP-4-dehydrorhamnose reductase